MAVLVPDGVDQFRVSFAELARVRRGQPLLVDPFLIARAIAEVMRACAVRSALGKPLVWNDYRVILARADFEAIRPMQAPLERDLKTVLAQEATTRQAELVGELRVTVVYDEANELAPATGVVRVAFAPTEKLAAPRAGEMTMRFDSFAVAGEIAAKPARGSDTVIVDDGTEPGCTLAWPGGEAKLVHGVTYVVGRPHDEPPARFVALHGASSRVNKQHFWIAATPTTIRIGRFAKANPVHVNEAAVAAGEELAVTSPVEIVLSRGDLTLRLR